MKFSVCVALKTVTTLSLLIILNLSILINNALAKELNIDFLYIEYKDKRPATLSNLIAPPGDDGLQGMRLGVKDNNTTGRFLKHTYKADEIIISHRDDFKAKLDEALKKHPNHPFIVANLPAEQLLHLADHPLAKNRLIFNGGSFNTDLRINQCRTNVLHTLPSRRMLTDALAQFLIKKRWKKIFIIEGLNKGDKEFSEQFKISAKKFRLKIVMDKKWPEGSDMRRNAAAEVPAFTQGADYDAVFIADEVKDFGQYVAFHTWLPRPIVGSHGMEAVAWHRVVEQWGAAQLQSRFGKLTKRKMAQKDYASWTAIRTVAEAVTRKQTIDIKIVKDYILGPDIRLAMFKGRSMSYRPWSGQMRQSIPLIHEGGAVIQLAPIEGFLHPKTELDTLGIDEGLAKCKVQS